MTQENRTGQLFGQVQTAREDVIRAARNLLLAVDSSVSESGWRGWSEVPIGVHCCLVMLGEKLRALDENAFGDPVNRAGKHLSEYLEPLPDSPDPDLRSDWIQW